MFKQNIYQLNLDYWNNKSRSSHCTHSRKKHQAQSIFQKPNSQHSLISTPILIGPSNRCNLARFAYISIFSKVWVRSRKRVWCPRIDPLRDFFFSPRRVTRRRQPVSKVAFFPAAPSLGMIIADFTRCFVDYRLLSNIFFFESK